MVTSDDVSHVLSGKKARGSQNRLREHGHVVRMLKSQAMARIKKR